MTTNFLEPVITQTSLSGLKLINRGKVRDIYDFNDALLIIATDRLSAFDVVMNEGIPYKGKVLTQISDFWFDQTKDIIQNHILSSIVYDFPLECKPYWDLLADRSMYVKKTKPLAVECIVRGYLSGSGWNEYKKSKSVCGIQLPDGLVESSKLPEPIFTPTTKEEVGKHDENITFEQMCSIVGKDLAEKVRDIAIKVYQRGAQLAEKKEILIADTKMEFGVNEGGEVILIDELLTPDSSPLLAERQIRGGTRTGKLR